MNCASATEALESYSETQRSALLSLLVDEDASVYQTVRAKILSFGPEAVRWLRPHTLSSEPVLRRRAHEIILHFGRQAADTGTRLEGPWKPFGDAGLLPDPSGLFLIARAITPGAIGG